jgi:hypothetical protein
MGTDLEKAQNSANMWAITALSMTIGIWDMVEDSATSLSPMIGEQILAMAEQIFQLKLAGESAEKIMIDLGRIFVNEFGLCGAVSVEMKDNAVVTVLKDSIGINEMKALQARGIRKFFAHPFLCAGLAALARTGIKTRANLVIDANNKDTTITFEYI